MAFVNEIISEEDKKRYDFSGIKRPPVYARPVDPPYWTIDRERNVFLAWTRGGTEYDQSSVQFALWWQGQVIEIDTEREAIGKFKEHVDIKWKLRYLRVPPSLNVSREGIVHVLKEALTAYRVGVGVPVASCSVNFDF